MTISYKPLKINDNGTVTVEMTIDGHILNQDFDPGADSSEFDANVKVGMAVFQSELDRNAAKPPIIHDHISLDQAIEVSVIPEVDPASLLEVQPEILVEQADET